MLFALCFDGHVDALDYTGLASQDLVGNPLPLDFVALLPGAAAFGYCWQSIHLLIDTSYHLATCDWEIKLIAKTSSQPSQAPIMKIRRVGSYLGEFGG